MLLYSRYELKPHRSISTQKIVKHIASLSKHKLINSTVNFTTESLISTTQDQFLQILQNPVLESRNGNGKMLCIDLYSSNIVVKFKGSEVLQFFHGLADVRAC